MSANADAVGSEEIGLEFPAAAEIVGTIAAVVPFFVSVTTSSTITVDGVVEAHRLTNWIALGGGAVALLVALWGFSVLGRSKPSARSKRIIGSVVLACVAAAQLARGFGLW